MISWHPNQVGERMDSRAAVRGWHERLAQPNAPSANAITVDVEDYFQVEAFCSTISRNDWEALPSRIEKNMHLILDLFSQSHTKATFFTLAWIASRFPALAKRIVLEGHEIASHGLEHRRVDNQSPKQFAEDVVESKKVLEDICGVAVKGYRAPSFSIHESNLWAFNVLADAGYQYSSSIYPISHDNYGIPSAPRFAFHPLKGSDFLEVPISSVRLLNRNWPCGGGGYFRLLPYAMSAAALSRVNKVDKRSCVFYFHPWEVDPDQPRVNGAGFKSRFRHYTNLHKTQERLIRLLHEFKWSRMDHVFLGSKMVCEDA